MTKVRWTVFLAGDDEHGWEERKFAHTNAFTNILGTHYDCTGGEPPEVGYRISDYKSEDGEKSTHYRKGDWVVNRVEVFVPDLPIASIYDEIAICQCVYDPIEPKWKAFKGKSIASLDSFGGDREAYNKFLLSDSADQYEIRFKANEPLTQEQIAKLKDEARASLVTV